MRNAIILPILAILGLFLAGCGGQIGRDSPTQVRLETTGSTVDFSALHVIISPNGGSAASVDAASDVQPQSWVSSTINGSLKELSFTTTSQRIPYFVYVQNTSGVQQQVRLRILMDGVEKKNVLVTVGANSTVQVETILRNNVLDP